MVNAIDLTDEPGVEDMKIVRAMSTVGNHYCCNFIPRGYLHFNVPSLHHTDTRWNVFRIISKRTDGEDGTLFLKIQLSRSYPVIASIRSSFYLTPAPTSTSRNFLNLLDN